VPGRVETYIYERTQAYLQRAFDFYMGRASTLGQARTSVDVYSTGSDNWPYQGCQWPALWFILKGLGHGGTFVDLGSGKGKALLIASMLPYRRVVGIEIDEGLAVAARHNIKSARRRARAELVECEVASAADYEIPDDACVIFMFNPFFGQTFRDAMTRVFDSLDRNPRELHLVYDFPWEHEWLLSTEHAVVESVHPGTWPSRRHWWAGEHVTVVYHLTATGQEARACRVQARRLSSARQRALARWVASTDHNFEVPSLNSCQWLN
jgi:predicted RNA methylase